MLNCFRNDNISHIAFLSLNIICQQELSDGKLFLQPSEQKFRRACFSKHKSIFHYKLTTPLEHPPTPCFLTC